MDFLTTLLQFILAIATPVAITAVSIILNRYIDYKLEAVKDEKMRNALREVNSIVFNAVNWVKQTYVDELKAQGKFDFEAQKTALIKAKQRIVDLMSEETKQILFERYGDIDRYLNTLVESLIAQSK